MPDLRSRRCLRGLCTLPWVVVLCAAGPVAAAALDYGDPTQPMPRRGGEAGRASAPPAPRWTLSSVLVAGERRVAVINGRSVALGATIDGARLLALDARGALIEHQGRRLRLDLPSAADEHITAKTPSGR